MARDPDDGPTAGTGTSLAAPTPSSRASRASRAIPRPNCGARGRARRRARPDAPHRRRHRDRDPRRDRSARRHGRGSRSASTVPRWERRSSWPSASARSPESFSAPGPASCRRRTTSRISTEWVSTPRNTERADLVRTPQIVSRHLEPDDEAGSGSCATTEGRGPNGRPRAAALLCRPCRRPRFVGRSSSRTSSRAPGSGTDTRTPCSRRSSTTTACCTARSPGQKRLATHGRRVRRDLSQCRCRARRRTRRAASAARRGVPGR